MKKEYKKPLVYIEDFTITQNIATCKENQGATHYDGDCTFIVGNLVYYYSDMEGKCIQFVDPPDDTDVEACYYGPIGGHGFAS